MKFWITGLLLLSSISPAVVLGQTTQLDEDLLFDESEQDAARAAFKDGRLAFERGDYAEALERFEHAYSLSGKSELLYNIGIAADRIREDDRALEAFEQYLKETPASPEREQVRMRVVALREARARQEREARSKEPRDAPSPAEVAAASVREPKRSEHTDKTSERDDGSVLGEWWFWTGAAVLLIGGGVTAYVLLQPGDDPEPLPRPNTGVVVPTLRLAP